MVKELLYNGEHQERGKVLVDDESAGKLLQSGLCKPLIGTAEFVFDAKWSEEKIKNEIEAKKIPVKYNTSNDTKKEVLERLKKAGIQVIE